MMKRKWMIVSVSFNCCNISSLFLTRIILSVAYLYLFFDSFDTLGE